MHFCLQTFDELVLLKRGGVIIYSGALGTNSSTMVSYFENIHGVPRIAENFNPVRLFLILEEFSSSLGRSFSVSEAFEMQEARSL